MLMIARVCGGRSNARGSRPTPIGAHDRVCGEWSNNHLFLVGQPKLLWQIVCSLCCDQLGDFGKLGLCHAASKHACKPDVGISYDNAAWVVPCETRRAATSGGNGKHHSVEAHPSARSVACTSLST